LEIKQQRDLSNGMVSTVQDIHDRARVHVGTGVCVTAALDSCIQIAFQWSEIASWRPCEVLLLAQR
jgi:hypothetical protein